MDRNEQRKKWRDENREHCLEYYRRHNAEPVRYTRGSYKTMVQRCYKKADRFYPLYGGRGITICDRWMLSFDYFLLDMGIRPFGKTLDRINTDGNYEPGNCRWATRSEQDRNTKRNRFITWNGRTLCMQDWAIETGIKASTINSRITELGWTIDEAMTTPTKR